jgi:hypothetical protein
MPIQKTLPIVFLPVPLLPSERLGKIQGVRLYQENLSSDLDRVYCIRECNPQARDGRKGLTTDDTLLRVQDKAPKKPKISRQRAPFYR